MQKILLLLLFLGACFSGSAQQILDSRTEKGFSVELKKTDNATELWATDENTGRRYGLWSTMGWLKVDAFKPLQFDGKSLGFLYKIGHVWTYYLFVFENDAWNNAALETYRMPLYLMGYLPESDPRFLLSNIDLASPQVLKLTEINGIGQKRRSSVEYSEKGTKTTRQE